MNKRLFCCKWRGGVKWGEFSGEFGEFGEFGELVNLLANLRAIDLSSGEDRCS